MNILKNWIELIVATQKETVTILGGIVMGVLDRMIRKTTKNVVKSAVNQVVSTTVNQNINQTSGGAQSSNEAQNANVCSVCGEHATLQAEICPKCGSNMSSQE